MSEHPSIFETYDNGRNACSQCHVAPAHPECFGLCVECDDEIGLWPQSLAADSAPSDAVTVRT